MPWKCTGHVVVDFCIKWRCVWVAWLMKSILVKVFPIEFFWFSTAENRNCPANFSGNFPYRILTKFKGIVMECSQFTILYIFVLGFIINNMAENRDWPISFGGSFTYWIPKKSVERFMGWIEKFIRDYMYTRLYYGSVGLKIGSPWHRLQRVWHIELQ
jgi:hypothetical protein